MAIQSRSGESAINSATLMGRLRGSAKKKTTAIRMKLSGCMHARDGSETGEQPSSIHEFLSSSPPARRHKHEETNAHGSSTHAWSQIRPHLQLELRSNHSQANISELSARPSGQFSISTVSLPSSVAAPGWENPPPDLTSKGKETLEEMVRNSLCRIYGSKHVAELPAADESVTSTQSSRYQPYSRPGSNKPVSYVIPALQAGYVQGVPPNLRAGHERHHSDMTNSPTSQNPHATDKQGREQYSWPLVDFEEEMFLNADPSRAGRPDDRRGLPKYQEPRIPDLDFASGRLEDEVAAVLGKLVVGERASTRSPMSRMGREHVHEMEAASPITNYVSPQTNSRGDCPPAQRVELEGTRYVTNISPERRRERQHQRQQTMSPVSPLSSEGGRVAYHDYNWPRFSEVQRYEDPAGEHSRRYRDRRREMRRDRAEERYR